MGEGSCRLRTWISSDTRRNLTCSTATPRSRRSRRVDSGSSSRVSTNDSGSSPSIGHSRSSDASNRSSREHRHQRAGILAARDRLPDEARRARAARQDRRAAARQFAERFEAPGLQARSTVFFFAAGRRARFFARGPSIIYSRGRPPPALKPVLERGLSRSGEEHRRYCAGACSKARATAMASLVTFSRMPIGIEARERWLLHPARSP